MNKVKIYKFAGYSLINLFVLGAIINACQSDKFQRFLANPSGELFPAIYGILASVTLNPLIWVGVLLLWRVDRNEKPDSQSKWLKIIKIYGALTIVMFLLTGYFIIKPNVIRNVENKEQNAYAQSDPVDNLSSSEKLRFREIVKEVMGYENMPTVEIHEEFWKLLYKTGMSDKDILQLKDTMTGISTTYMKYFYEDALIALSEGRVYKSKQREDYEKRLLQLGLMTEFRIKDNENLITQIVEGKPIKIDAENQIVLTKEIIEPIIANLNQAGQRIQKLFSKEISI